MKTNRICLHGRSMIPASDAMRLSRLKRRITILIMCCMAACGIHTAWAVIPEPENIIYGIAGNEVNSVSLKIGNRIVASDIPGSKTGAEAYYILRVAIDTTGQQGSDKARPGDQAALYVNDKATPVLFPVLIGERGRVQKINLGDVDNDKDSLPDQWETEYGLNCSDGQGENGKDGDPDKDNWTNYQEYLAGTDPSDAASAPPNTLPSAPALNYPGNGHHTASLRPVLSVSNAADIDGQPLSYNFELYRDAGMTDAVSLVTGIQEDINTTAWKTDQALSDNTSYYWRARAFDGHGYSPWMETAVFFVNTANGAPEVPKPDLPIDGAGVPEPSPLLVILNSDDADQDQLAYDFKVFQGPKKKNRC